MMSQFLFPYHETHHPVARTSELQRLVDWSKESEPGPMLIYGSPGVGKTELVTQFAHQYQSKFPGGVCWIQANSLGILAGYSMFAVEAFDMEMPFTEAPTPQDRFSQIMSNWPQNGPVLVVIEDVVSNSDVQSFIPKDAQFYTIVTTSQKMDWSSNYLHLDSIPQEDAKLWMLTSPQLNESSEIKVGVLTIAEMLKGDFFGIKWLQAYLKNSFPQDRMPKIKEILNVCHHDAESESNLLQAGFGLIWGNLHQQAQQLATLISDLPSVSVPWRLIELSASQIGDTVELDICRRFLIRYDLIRQRGESLFEMHPQVAGCIRRTRSPLQTEQQSVHGFLQAVFHIADKMPDCPPSEDFVNLYQFGPFFEYAVQEHIGAIPAEPLSQIMMGSSILFQCMNEFERALAICQKGCAALLQKEEIFPDTMTNMYQQQVNLNMMLGQPKEAMVASLQQFDWLKQTKNPRLSQLKSLVQLIIYLAQQTGESDLVERFQKQLIELMDAAPGGDPLERFRRLQEKENVFQKAEQKKEVSDCYWEQLELTETHPLELAKHWAMTWKTFFVHLEFSQQSDRSAEMLLRSLAILNQDKMEHLAAVVEIQVELAGVLLKQNRAHDAALYFQSAMEGFETMEGASNPIDPYLLSSMCRVALKLGLDETHDMLKKRMDLD